MLELLGADGKVVGVDIDIRAHNRTAIEAHPMFKRIELIQGSSIDADIVAEVKHRVAGCKRIMVVLDSNHTHYYVLAELHAYSGLVTQTLPRSATVVEDMPDEFFPLAVARLHSPGSGARAFLGQSARFEVDRSIDERLLITVSPEGFLRCVPPRRTDWRRWTSASSSRPTSAPICSRRRSIPSWRRSGPRAS